MYDDLYLTIPKDDRNYDRYQNKSEESDTEIDKISKFTITILKVPGTDKHCVE